MTDNRRTDSIDTEEKTIRYIMLSQMKGIGPVTPNALLNICGEIERCFRIDEDELIEADIRAHSGIGRKRISLFVSQRDNGELRGKAEGIFIDSQDKGIDVDYFGLRAHPIRF